MSETSNYCDYPNNSCLLQDQLIQARKELLQYKKALLKYANPATATMDASGFVWAGDWIDTETAQTALAPFCVHEWSRGRYYDICKHCFHERIDT